MQILFIFLASTNNKHSTAAVIMLFHYFMSAYSGRSGGGGSSGTREPHKKINLGYLKTLIFQFKLSNFSILS